MALFGKLFEKKQCSICGSDIGLLGNRKLEDGTFICGNYARSGKSACTIHSIYENVLEELVLTDIREKARFVECDGIRYNKLRKLKKA